eukprot:CAMPEP_0175092120 /NCGR_PEP_ID=MMETSP0086_2-20121207/2287_1 /TAXON_ID=136419 /ORGANISM="Unknown Unknown, Strain D1" /LENGTH=106 /DNA_ID=CAMNT_0016364949 /DNA_START=519 /DNA_END=837 /DNA_ORIENTATION=+
MARDNFHLGCGGPFSVSALLRLGLGPGLLEEAATEESELEEATVEEVSASSFSGGTKDSNAFATFSASATSVSVASTKSVGGITCFIPRALNLGAAHFSAAFTCLA